jgi:hypothetical protein
MEATTANRVCYYCQQPGHIASTCPLKQQHRQQQGGPRPGWQPTRPGYQRPPTSYQGPPAGGRNSVPSRPVIPPRPIINPTVPQQDSEPPHHWQQHPTHPQQQPPQAAHYSHYGEPSQHLPLHPRQRPQAPVHPYPDHRPYMNPTPHAARPTHSRSIRSQGDYFQAAPQANHSAFVSTEFEEEDDYYSAHLGAAIDDYQEDDCYQDSAEYDCCYVSVAEDAEGTLSGGTRHVLPAPHSAYLLAGIESPSSMARIHKMPLNPVPSTVDHWLELCSGGMLAGLSAALASGIAVKTVTLIEKSRMVRFMVVARLSALHQLHPTLLSNEAIDHPFKVEQDVTKVSASDFKALPTVTVVFATPPCQPFSKAGSTPGWDTDESKPFISCANLIRELSSAQRRSLTYFVENVPNSAQFTEITDALGPALIVEAHRLGSSAYRKTALWTNAAPHETLMQHYQDHQLLGQKVLEFLKEHGFTEWKPTAYTGA